MSVTGELLVAGRWCAGEGGAMHSEDPVLGTPIWRGAAASPNQVAAAVAAAARVQVAWAARSWQERLRLLERFAALVTERGHALAGVLSDEVGKPAWEAAQEIAAVSAKVATTAASWRQEVEVPVPAGTSLGQRPLGVMAVLGPFNFPCHLPNGQIIPALLAGNAVVFKPSERSPACGELLVRCLVDAGLPPGLIGLVQGGAEVGAALVDEAAIAGVLFTGSVRGGQALHRQLAGRPEVLLALEMGGNNPLVVWDAPAHAGTVRLVVLSAFLSAGQRCTCARRLIVPDDRRGLDLAAAVARALPEIVIAHHRSHPQPFAGPVLDDRARAALAARQERIAAADPRRILVPLGSSGHERLVTPGLVDVTGLELPDEELFGPLLQIQRVVDFDAAIATANATRFGLAAALIDADPERWRRFRSEVRAGVINRNRQTTGASGGLPFGGCGISGNHRPAGATMHRSCYDPVASLGQETIPAAEPHPGLP